MLYFLNASHPLEVIWHDHFFTFAGADHWLVFLTNKRDLQMEFKQHYFSTPGKSITYGIFVNIIMEYLLWVTSFAQANNFSFELILFSVRAMAWNLQNNIYIVWSRLWIHNIKLRFGMKGILGLCMRRM